MIFFNRASTEAAISAIQKHLHYIHDFCIKIHFLCIFRKVCKILVVISGISIDRRGLYQLPQNVTVTDEQIIKKILPQGIVCVESALFHYGYSDFVISGISIDSFIENFIIKFRAILETIANRSFTVIN